MGRGQQEGGNGEVGKWEGEKKGQGGNFSDGYEEPARNEVTGFSDFVYPCNAGYPS